ncbi:hypothetical protein GCM10010254_23240 [Streptomyces chromofuscus]|nr:hypothetical protein GCM10010254_23240 [Streptomyces chromofuscus]
MGTATTGLRPRPLPSCAAATLVHDGTADGHNGTGGARSVSAAGGAPLTELKLSFVPSSPVGCGGAHG